MAVLYISEYAGTQFQGGNVVSPAQELALADQTVAIGAGSAQSAAFTNKTNVVRLSTDGQSCCIAFGTNPTATATNKRMPANSTEYFGVQPGWKVANITIA